VHLCWRRGVVVLRTAIAVGCVSILVAVCGGLVWGFAYHFIDCFCADSVDGEEEDLDEQDEKDQRDHRRRCIMLGCYTL